MDELIKKIDEMIRGPEDIPKLISLLINAKEYLIYYDKTQNKLIKTLVLQRRKYRRLCKKYSLLKLSVNKAQKKEV